MRICQRAGFGTELERERAVRNQCGKVHDFRPDSNHALHVPTCSCRSAKRTNVGHHVMSHVTAKTICDCLVCDRNHMEWSSKVHSVFSGSEVQWTMNPGSYYNFESCRFAYTYTSPLLVACVFFLSY